MLKAHNRMPCCAAVEGRKIFTKKTTRPLKFVDLARNMPFFFTEENAD